MPQSRSVQECLRGQLRWADARASRSAAARLGARSRPAVAAVPASGPEPVLRRPGDLGRHAPAVTVPGAGSGCVVGGGRSVLPHQPDCSGPRIRGWQVVRSADRPADAVQDRCGGGPGRLGRDGVRHPGVGGVRAQPHRARLRRGDGLTDLRRGAGPAGPCSHRCGQPGDVDGPARVQSRLHDRPAAGQRARRRRGDTRDAGRGGRLHPVAGPADDRSDRSPRRARAGSGPEQPGRPRTRSAPRAWCPW